MAYVWAKIYLKGEYSKTRVYPRLFSERLHMGNHLQPGGFVLINATTAIYSFKDVLHHSTFLLHKRYTDMNNKILRQDQKYYIAMYDCICTTLVSLKLKGVENIYRNKITISTFNYYN